MNETTVASPTHSGIETLDENGKTHVSAERGQSHNGDDDPLQQILAAVVAFRDGDFTVRLPLSWPGIEGRIAEALNQTMAHEARITDEITRLSVTVGKEGRLKQRLSLPPAAGSWALRAQS